MSAKVTLGLEYLNIEVQSNDQCLNINQIGIKFDFTEINVDFFKINSLLM